MRLTRAQLLVVAQAELESLVDRFEVDVKGESILYRFVRKVDDESLAPLVVENVGLRGKRLSPYVFSHNTSSVSIEQKKVTPKPKPKRGEKKLFTGKDEPESSLTVDVLLNPVDLCLLTADDISELHPELSTNKQLHLAKAFLSAPLEADFEYLTRIIATTIRETKKVEAMIEKRTQVIGSFASLLCGVDVLEILKCKHEVYNGHVQAFRGQTKSGLPTQGFTSYAFFPLRIFFTLNILVSMHLGLIADANLGEKLLERYAGNSLAARDHRVRELTKELGRNLQAYWLARYGYYIAMVSGKSEEKDELTISLLGGLIASIKKLDVGESSILAVGWKGHALYLRVHKLPDNKWNLLLHNLGEGNERHESSKESSSSVPQCRPCKLAKLSESEWSVGGSGYRYLAALFKIILEPVTPADIAKPIIYDFGKDKIFVPKPGVELITEDYALFPEQGKTGNCVYAAYESARALCFEDYSSLVREEDKIASEVNRYPALAFELDRDLWGSFAVNPERVIATSRGSDQRLKFLVDHIDNQVLKEVYLKRYNTIPSLWKEKEWDELSLPMEKFYLDLKLVERSRHDKSSGEDSVNLTSLVNKSNTHHWIVGQLGSGKSTLMQKIAYSWAKGELGADYKQVILFPLRKLKNDAPLSLSIEERISYFLADVYLGEKLSKADCTYIAGRIFHPDIKEQTLWLLDGYDEVALALDSAQEEVLNYLKAQTQVLISVRPEGHPYEEAAKPHIVIKGLEAEQIKRWIIDYAEHSLKEASELDSEAKKRASADEIYRFLSNDDRVWELVHSPINLKLACMAFSRGYIGSEHIIKTPTQLYDAICQMLAERHYERQGKKDISAAHYWGELDFALSEIAIAALNNAKLEISPSLIIEINSYLCARNYSRNWVLEMIDSGIVRKTSSTHRSELTAVEFLHASFQQYFAAKAVVRNMATMPEGEFNAWFAKHKFDVLYQAVWRFVAGLLPSTEMTDRWVRLWLQLPYRLEKSDDAYALFVLMSDSLQESSFLRELKCRDQLVKLIDTKWARRITKLPEGIVRLIRCFGLWEHLLADKWINSLAESLYKEEFMRESLQLLSEIPSIAITRLKPYLESPDDEMAYKTAIALARLKEITIPVVELLEECLDKSTNVHLLSLTIETIQEFDIQFSEVARGLINLFSRVASDLRYREVKFHAVRALSEQKISDVRMCKQKEEIFRKCLGKAEQDGVAEWALRGLQSLDLISNESILAIMACLVDDRKNVVKKASEVLRQLIVSDTEAKNLIVSHLVKMLQEGIGRSKEEKKKSQEMLCASIPHLNVQDDRLVTQLIEEARKPPRSVYPVRALGELKSPRPDVIDFLVSLAGDKAATIDLRSEAIDALAEIATPTPAVIAAILNYINGDNSKLHDSACIAMTCLRYMDEKVMSRLMDSLDRKGSLASSYQGAAIEALAKMSNPDERLIDRLFRCKLSGLEDKDWACKIVEKFYVKDPKARDFLLNKLQKSSEREESEAVLKIIIEIVAKHKADDARIQPLLIDKLDSGYHSIRSLAFASLLEMNFYGDKVLSRLIALAFDEKTELKLRVSSIKILARLKLKELRDRFAALLENASVANAAALALMEMQAFVTLDVETMRLLISALSRNIENIVLIRDDECVLSIQGAHYLISGADKVSLWVESFPGINELKSFCSAIVASYPLVETSTKVPSLLKEFNVTSLPVSGGKRGRGLFDSVSDRSSSRASDSGINQDWLKKRERLVLSDPALSKDPWYDDLKINKLAKKFASDFPAVIALSALPYDDATEAEAALIRAAFLSGMRSDVNQYFLPLRVSGNHWVALFVDITPGNPRTIWLDPFARSPDKTKLLRLLYNTGLFSREFGEDQIMLQQVQLQNDGINCGPYIIEMFRFLMMHERLAGVHDIDINSARLAHTAVLQALDVAPGAPPSLADGDVLLAESGLRGLRS